MPRPYPPEFRRRALDLIESGRTVRDVAASLGIAESCLHRWRHRDLVDRGVKPGVTAQEGAELAAARQRIRDLEEEVKILRKAAAAVEAVVPPKDRYRLVAELRADGVRIGRACHALGVSRSGYYAWAARAPSPRAIRHAWLTDLIGTAHHASRGTYGAPRIHAELVLGHGITVGRNTISLLMRRAGLAGLPAHSHGKRTKRLITVTDLVRRDFRRRGPNQLVGPTSPSTRPARARLYSISYVESTPACRYLLVGLRHGSVPARPAGTGVLRGMAAASVLGRWPVLERHERAAEWLGIWADLGRAPRTIDAYARGLAEYLEACERDGIDPVAATRAEVAAFVRELTDPAQPPRRERGGAGLGRRAGERHAAAAAGTGAAVLRLPGRGRRPGVQPGRPRPLYPRAALRRRQRAGRPLVPRMAKLPWIPSRG